MGRILRNIGFFLLVGVITLIIFLLVVQDQQVKNNVLDYTLNVLGGKLLAMVPEGTGKELVRERYESFVNQVKNREVTPAQVEQVAANILNASNVDHKMSPEEAVLILSVEAPVPIDSAVELAFYQSTDKKLPAPPSPPGTTRYHIKAEVRDWRKMEKRLGSIIRLNENLQKAIEKGAKRAPQIQHQIQYHFDTGLRLAIDTNIKNILDSADFKNLSKDLQLLEQEKLLIWQEGLAEALSKNLENLSQRLQALEELKHLEQLQALQHLHGLEALSGLESLRALESLKGLSVLAESLKTGPLSADSIRKIVEESLKDAGISPQPD